MRFILSPVEGQSRIPAKRLQRSHPAGHLRRGEIHRALDAPTQSTTVPPSNHDGPSPRGSMS
jgi:hypothetical protein